MLTNIWSKRKSSSYYMSSKSDEEEEGLRIITKELVDKPSLQIVKPVYLLNQIIKSISSCPSDHDHNYSYCYLKSCHLCHNQLSLDKEVYMYMGNLGFCSLECRDGQIYLDDIKEMEISTKRVLASFRQRRRDGGGRCDTNNSQHLTNRVIFS